MYYVHVLIYNVHYCKIRLRLPLPYSIFTQQKDATRASLIIIEKFNYFFVIESHFIYGRSTSGIMTDPSAC